MRNHEPEPEDGPSATEFGMTGFSFRIPNSAFRNAGYSNGCLVSFLLMISSIVGVFFMAFLMASLVAS